MRILHIDETFHPSFGYQVNSLAKYQAEHGHEVYVITTQHDKLHYAFMFSSDNDRVLEYDQQYSESTGVKIVRLPVWRFISGRAIYKRQIFGTIDEIAPDVIMSHQVETYISIVSLIKGIYDKYPIVYDSHMLGMATKNKLAGYYNWFYKKLPASRINKNDIKVIKTQDDNYVNEVLGIDQKLTPFISFGSDTLLFHPDPEARRKFRQANSIGSDDFVIVYTGKLDEAKGGELLASVLKDKIGAGAYRDVTVVVVGNSFVNDYGQKVERIFTESENRIIRFPTQRYVDLPQFYQAADLCIFAKQCSLSFYDAQACGLPVVSEDNNINADRLRHNNGFNFKADDVDDFRKKIIQCIEMPEDDYQQMGRNALKYITDNYDYDHIARQYTQVMMDEINRFAESHPYRKR